MTLSHPADAATSPELAYLPGTKAGAGSAGSRSVTIFLATREHGLPMCVAIAERLGVPVAERILVASDTSDTYEAQPSFPLEQRTAYADQFAQVIDWNQMIWPDRPHGWLCEPGSSGARMARALLVPDPEAAVRLVLESVQVPPATALMNVFPGAEVHLYSDGLMTYGGRSLPLTITARVQAMHYRDLLPPIHPRLVDHKTDVRYHSYLFEEIEQHSVPAQLPEISITGPTGVVLLQYLSHLGLVSPAEELKLTKQMIAAAVAAGCTTVLVKAHPAHRGALGALTDPRTDGVIVHDFPGWAPLESWLLSLSEADRAQVTVVSCFSTALPGAIQLGARGIAVGTDALLSRVPRVNGNYVPLVVCDSICETVPLHGQPTPQPARIDPRQPQPVDITLEVLSHTLAPGAHWRTRTDLAARVKNLSRADLDHLHRYVSTAEINGSGLTADADISPDAPSVRFEPIAAPLVADEFKLSVVVPAYNIAAFAESLSSSIRANSASDIEWVLINDGSTDATSAELTRMASELANVTVLTHPKSKGPSAARNTGILAAKGTYVGFMDADDWLRPGYLHEVRDQAEAHQVDLLRFGFVEVNGTTATFRPQPVIILDTVISPRDHIMPVDQSTAVDLPNPWLSVCNRKFLYEHGLLFDADLHTAEDREWTWRLFVAATTMVVASTVGYYWRRGVSDSLTQVGDERQLHFIDAYARVADLLSGTADEVFLPKVYRTTIAIGMVHLTRKDRLPPRLRFQAARDLRRTVRRIPANELALSMSRFRAGARTTLTLLRARGVPIAAIPVLIRLRPLLKAAAAIPGATALFKVK
jgi:glycosyltransferase involved in cell wall biosynthesis